ncbi:hypothetical protein BDN72DRAFT_962538 [Pluteus cervinus]|uniref:Uncharacterized protein n=1 Tax=Pluteus cervinus TaxID=181527 RepID=A0ACD3AIL4_9AGAR|nr:hypothetical protein BDN72DRAFT_962538 [Pluteus cervinus]
MNKKNKVTAKYLGAGTRSILRGSHGRSTTPKPVTFKNTPPIVDNASSRSTSHVSETPDPGSSPSASASRNRPKRAIREVATSDEEPASKRARIANGSADEGESEAEEEQVGHRDDEEQPNESGEEEVNDPGRHEANETEEDSQRAEDGSEDSEESDEFDELESDDGPPKPSGIEWKGDDETCREAEAAYQDYMKRKKILYQSHKKLEADLHDEYTSVAKLAIQLFLLAKNPLKACPLPMNFRKALREKVDLLPETGCASMVLTLHILTSSGFTNCLTHYWRRYQFPSTNSRTNTRCHKYGADATLIDCGCSPDVASLEFFMWKTWQWGPPYLHRPLMRDGCREILMLGILNLLGIDGPEELFNERGTGWDDPLHQLELKKVKMASLEEEVHKLHAILEPPGLEDVKVEGDIEMGEDVMMSEGMASNECGDVDKVEENRQRTESTKVATKSPSLLRNAGRKEAGKAGQEAVTAPPRASSSKVTLDQLPQVPSQQQERRKSGRTIVPSKKVVASSASVVAKVVPEKAGCSKAGDDTAVSSGWTVLVEGASSKSGKEKAQSSKKAGKGKEKSSRKEGKAKAV